MKKKLYLAMMLPAFMFLLTGCQSNGSDPSFFQRTFVEPFTKLIHFFAEVFGGSYGISIIVITLLIRLILMPLMLRQYKAQQKMKGKMELFKPEMDNIQKKLKQTKDPKEQQKLQQEMMALYQKHGVNPLQMGCLPILVQMPILMGLYYAIRGSKDIAAHSFLWFNLGQPDILITIAAGIIYYLQFKVTQANLPEQQRKQMRFFGLLSPLMILMVSFNAPAALPLYWTVGGSFLILQTLISRRIYNEKQENVEEKAKK
ncbi:membrane protein insertase YidC [Mesobacillus zeae]|uniref:Membrane protein insertase YidC n=1 Tax=Mesobacillus zeae TaxID=1917180 RepID=A0A398B7X1_9BACI|nr:membrane protein insertase YidC [Mesobacillus zeae]RID85584.1 membrane protein insertase YidC [Mesobacillus zeae]